jgi:hypothetical protein
MCTAILDGKMLPIILKKIEKKVKNFLDEEMDK